MAANKSTLLGVEDYRSLPETGPQHQLVRGELHVSPAPNRYHQDISRNIEVLLVNYLEQHPLGKIYDAPFDVYLTEHDVFQPDIVFVANDRLSILTAEGANGPPTLVIEILSPGTSRLDRSEKKTVYASTGVEEFWLVDPEEKTLAVFRLQEDSENPAQMVTSEATFSSACFPDLRIDCRRIFKS